MLDFHQTLSEIVEKIEIGRDFSIRHPDYPAIELHSDTIASLQRIPPQFQTKYLMVRVQNYLYDIYFSHSLMSLKEIEVSAQQPLKIKNNIIDGIDIDFYQRLQQSNTSSGYIDPDWLVVTETERGELVVVKDGLHLHIDRQQHLPLDLQQAVIGAVVPIYLPHNLVGRDTYITIGNAGIPDCRQSSCSERGSQLVEVYFNFTPDVAIAISQKLTYELNRLGIPFQFAILHDPALFYRYDSGTLSLSQAGYLEVQTVLAKIYQVYQAEFAPNIPLFSKQLAPGLGLAEVPIGSGTVGMHRCQLLATGLLTAMAQGQTLATDQLTTIRREFSTAGINWLQPYLSPSALDCYSVYSIE